MKVALELQPCCGRRSGIGTYAWELARRMRNGDGLEFCGDLFNFLGRNDNAQALEGVSMPLRECRAFPYGVYRRIWNLIPIRYGDLFPPPVDLGVFFDYIVPPRFDGKAVQVIHDMSYLRFPETMSGRNLRRLRNGLQRSVSASSRIVTISEFSKREIVELLGAPEERVSVVYSAPSLSGKAADYERTAEKFSIRSPFILYVGTIEPRKNLERLLRAFEALKREKKLPHQLVLAGGRGWRSEEIYKTAESLSCPEAVVFTGYLSQAEKEALYQNAAVFVFPSLYEGFGMPPLEAMALGCPVVCSNAASLPEVTGGAAEMADPLDEGSIAAGLWRVLSDAEYAEALRQKGRRQAERFTWEASAGKLAAVCREVLEET